MRSMLPNPHSLCAAVPNDDIIGYFKFTGLLSTEVVLRTTPAHPAFSPSIAMSSSSVGGAADRMKGFSRGTPRKSYERSCSRYITCLLPEMRQSAPPLSCRHTRPPQQSEHHERRRRRHRRPVCWSAYSPLH